MTGRETAEEFRALRTRIAPALSKPTGAGKLYNDETIRRLLAQGANSPDQLDGAGPGGGAGDWTGGAAGT